ncbi:hypothetical protein AB0B45_50275 [Nonomuraea sp. NPDC049152]|uniref:hypothetical protein n=1 Tax=Nonomuraea sp. NPDC049152 TaxID=3154350 RepID=UPI003409513E
MWRTAGNWAALALVAGFAVLWTGVVVFVADTTPAWIRAAQVLFGVMLAAWAVHKARSLRARHIR